MSNRRRIIIIIISITTGTLLSALLLRFRRNTDPLNGEDANLLITNFVLSLAIILGIGFFFIWRKKKGN